MKNLFDKLKPEIKAAIEVDLEKYPNSTSALVNHLKDTHYVTDLKYGEALKLMSYHYEKLGKYPGSAYECFLDN